jgi:hypothetical protein
VIRDLWIGALSATAVVAVCICVGVYGFVTTAMILASVLLLGLVGGLVYIAAFELYDWCSWQNRRPGDITNHLGKERIGA